MEIKVSTEKGVRPISVMHVDGNIDSASYQEFQSKADELIDSGARDILIDLTHVHFVSSAGIRAIHALFNKLRTLVPDVSDEELRKGINAGTYKSPHLKLLNPSKETTTTFEMTGLDMYIDIYKDFKKAISSF
jgi:anti-anti-sigma regulatory factor